MLRILVTLIIYNLSFFTFFHNPFSTSLSLHIPISFHFTFLCIPPHPLCILHITFFCIHLSLIIPPSTSLILSTFPSPHLHILFQHGKKRCEATHLCDTLIFHLCIYYISLFFPHLSCTLPNEKSTYHNMKHGKKHNMPHAK